MFLAVEKENIEIVKLLLSHKNIDVNAQCISKHKIYSRKSNDEQVKTKILSILHLAVVKENIELIKLLLLNPNIDVDNKYFFKNVKLVDALWSPGEKIIEEKTKTALQLAFENKNKEIVHLFLNCKKIVYNPIFTNISNL